LVEQVNKKKSIPDYLKSGIASNMAILIGPHDIIMIPFLQRVMADVTGP